MPSNRHILTILQLFRMIFGLLRCTSLKYATIRSGYFNVWFYEIQECGCSHAGKRQTFLFRTRIVKNQSGLIAPYQKDLRSSQNIPNSVGAINGLKCCLIAEVIIGKAGQGDGSIAGCDC